MAYIPETNSVVAFQSDPTKLVATVSVVSTVPTSVSGTVGASIIGAVPVTIPSVAVNIISGSVAVSVTPPANQSVSGTVQTDVRGSVATVIIGGSIAASFTPPANQSVSGTVGASVIGLTPINVTNTNINVSGSVAAWLQSTNASIITVGSPVANQSVSGTVGASVIGLTPVSVSNFPAVQPVAPNNSSIYALQLAGSILAVDASFTPPANQSVSGTVNVGNFPTTQNVSGSVATFQAGTRVTSLVSTIPSSVIVGASIFGLAPVNVTNTNLNVSGSVVAFQGSAPWANTNVGSVITVGQGSVAVNIIAGSVAVSVTPPANQSVSGTVGASLIGTAPVTQAGTWIASVFGNMSVIGTVPVTQSGTFISSLVSTIPSSVIVGTSIFGQLPAGTAPLGSVATLQGTNPWIVNFQNSSILANTSNTSVITLFSKSPSIVGTYAEDAGHTTADKGVFILGVRNDTVASFTSANLDYGPHATDSAGRILTKPFSAEQSRIEGYASVVSTSVTTLVAAAGAGLKNYITDIILANTGATTTLVTFLSGGGTSVLGYGIAPAGGGSNMIGFATPMRTLANETFDFQATSASSILFAKVSGFKAP